MRWLHGTFQSFYVALSVVRYMNFVFLGCFFSRSIFSLNHLLFQVNVKKLSRSQLQRIAVNNSSNNKSKNYFQEGTWKMCIDNNSFFSLWLKRVTHKIHKNVPTAISVYPERKIARALIFRNEFVEVWIFDEECAVCWRRAIKLWREKREERRFGIFSAY